MELCVSNSQSTFALYFLCEKLVSLISDKSISVLKYKWYNGMFHFQRLINAQQSPATLPPTVDREKVYLWIVELSNPDTRENALLELRLLLF